MAQQSKTGSAQVSFAQERFWFLDQINPGDVSANISRGIRIMGELNHDLLQQSLQAIVDRHESLRTTFATNQLHAVKDSKPVQLIAPNSTVAIPLADLSREPEVEIKARDLAKKSAQTPFDLTLGPLLRVTLLRLKEREHVLVLVLHRIVCDEWSLEVLIDELWEAYGTFAKKEPWPLAPLPVQYADFAVQQRQSIEKESFQSAVDFWHTNFEGAPAVIELPTDRPRPSVRTWHGQTVSLNLNAELLGKLRVIGTSHNATLATVLLAALRVVLARCGRQNDLVIGTTVPNRDSSELKHAIGPFSNLLSLRSSVSGNSTFVELLAREYSTLVKAHAHGVVPFEKLLDDLRLERTLSHTPLFQVTFNLHEVDDDRSEVAGLKLERFEFDEADVIGYDLMVDALESPSSLVCRFRYSTDIFDHTTIERLAGHFKNVLDGIVNNPNQKVSALPLLAASEQRQILVDWNNTERTFDQPQNITHWFERQASVTPSATAVTFQDQKLTYAELNARANQLAHYLRLVGVGPEVLVGICVERSLEMIVGLLGILKAGGAYLPLDPAYPVERLRFMLDDANARLVLTQERLLNLLPESQAEVFCLDRDWLSVSRQREENPASSAAAENLAYVIYTSGSTGKPKGVAIQHSSAVALIAWARSVFCDQELSGVLASTSICFDLSVFEIFLPLSFGGKILLAENLLNLPSLVSAQDVKLINTVPSAMVELLRLGGVPASVQTVNLAGEPLRADLVETIYELPHVKRVNDLYGPSEDTTYSTHALRQSGGPTTIGRPIANTQVYLLDENFQPVPIGVPGELYLGGAGLARGYLNHPELTAKAFLPDPFTGKAGARLYKTGDLARYLADGNVEYIGRLDDQVKIRGFRIELGEIETVLREHSLVRDVVVVAREGNLIAYVVASDQQTDRAKLWAELRSLIKSRLPEYMLPSSFVELDALPLTSSGKVDRRNLPVPDQSRPDLQQAYVAPRDRVEEQLVTLWTHLLKLKSVGVRDNFFELGGHSLLAARLFAQIENRLGKHLPLATLFQSPTIEQLANVLRNSQERSWSSLVAIQPEGSRQRLFCIHAAGANVLIYRPLSRHLGNDQPVYALQAQGLDGSRPLKTVEQMAAHYIEEMRLFQREGPYHLLGASFGGLVIYEMAYQLSRENQEVGLVAMLNTNCPVYTLGKRIASHVVHLREQGPRFYGRAVINGVARRINRYVPLGDFSSGPGANGAARDLELRQVLEADRDRDEALVRTVSAILRAEEIYDPAGKFYPGRVTLFRAIDDKQDFHDNRLGWGNLAHGGFEVYDVPGTHTSMREEPNVAVLVEKLKPCLEKA